MDREPIMTLDSARSANPWNGFTSSAEEEAGSMKVKAYPSFPPGFKPLAALEPFDRLTGGLLLARSEERREVGANAAFFSDLARVDATRPSTLPAFIGRWTAPFTASMTPRKLAEFLIASQLVITYWHVSSSLRLVDEWDDGRKYRAEFEGEHIYFTSERHVSGIAFAMALDRETGEIAVETLHGM
ncbi:MAG: hypothetical protein NT080_07540 [Spirochaetes bacterium]|nr:hypothetical protein [Spirochaetota bacterium]